MSAEVLRPDHRVAELVTSWVERGEDDGAVMRRRAAELARRRSGGETREPLAEVVVVRRKELLLAAPLTAAREVRQVRVARLPVAQRAISGLFQVRGRTDCLVDLTALTEDAEPIAHGKETLALILTGPNGDLGLRIDEVIGARRLYVDEIADDDSPMDWVQKVTVDMVHLIDINGLMACADILVVGDRHVAS